MLTITIQSHPLLKKLSEEKPTHKQFMLGLHEHHLKPSKKAPSFIIGEKEIIQVFKNRCSVGDVEGVAALLNFDYMQLMALDSDHPFYIQKSPLNRELLLQQLVEANYFSKQSISLVIQKYMFSWLLEQLSSEKSLFCDEVAESVQVVALYNPHLAFNCLKKTFTSEFKLSNAHYNNENYAVLLSALEDIAYHKEYFEFSAELLLKFAAKEAKLGVYHGHYKALRHLTDLFRNACARTQMSLRDTKIILDKLIFKADKQADYYRLYVLMKVLGTAANVFESGEHTYVEDAYLEGYIHFAIEVLMRYAGIDDDNGLCLTAEEELHHLLENTITEPEIWGASDVPFLIFRYFIKYEREWNMDPFYQLNRLEEFIDDCKKEEEEDLKDYIPLLELRLEQLISLVADREFVSEDFLLYLSSKSPEKLCDIGIDYQSEQQLELHARQSLAERLIFSGTTNLHDIQRGWPKCTYVMANFGMIISDMPHEPDSKHKRLFRTIAVRVPKYTITGRTNKYNGHAEEALYEYLLDEKNILSLLEQFKAQFGINADNHKVYGVIFDLHGTYDMCVSCSKKGLNFQDAFRKKLLSILPEQALKTRKKFPAQLPIVIRYSSDFKYHYYNTDNDQKREP